MAQLKDLIVTGPTRCVGPTTFSETIKIGNAIVTYDKDSDALKIIFEEEE